MVDLSGANASVTLVTTLPEAKLLNGMNSFQAGASKGLLVADFVVGGVLAG